MRVTKRNAKEKERNHNQQRGRRTELGIFSIMIFDSATSRFIALLVTESNKKTKVQKSKEVSTSCSEKDVTKPFCVSKVLSSNQSPSFVGQ